MRTWIVASWLALMPRSQTGPELAVQVLCPRWSRVHNRGRACLISKGVQWVSDTYCHPAQHTDHWEIWHGE